MKTTLAKNILRAAIVLGLASTLAACEVYPDRGYNDRGHGYYGHGYYDGGHGRYDDHDHYDGHDRDHDGYWR